MKIISTRTSGTPINVVQEQFVRCVMGCSDIEVLVPLNKSCHLVRRVCKSTSATRSKHVKVYDEVTKKVVFQLTGVAYSRLMKYGKVNADSNTATSVLPTSFRVL